MASTKDYVLGTQADEIERLGLQHRVWRQCALAVWQSAGIGPGQTVLDVGCGPGYASLDLAELVGPTGRVVAIDKSERFLRALDAMCHERRIDNITTYSADLDAGEFLTYSPIAPGAAGCLPSSRILAPFWSGWPPRLPRTESSFCTSTLTIPPGEPFHRS